MTVYQSLKPKTELLRPKFCREIFFIAIDHYSLWVNLVLNALPVYSIFFFISF